ncbi:LCCL domain-containing protein [Ruegeria lacuscaerulensis]|uniref:LCCL domain-containing protein n=1 Tax=Ruegeria lacuscaerulensis TaxID=55218 RepID=UPI00147F7BEF
MTFRAHIPLDQLGYELDFVSKMKTFKKTLKLSGLLIGLSSVVGADHQSNALHSGMYGDCWQYRYPWRVTVCECSGNTDGQLYGDRIYKQGSNPCSAAAHSGLLDPEGNGTIAIEPHTGLQEYRSSERNGIRSSEATGGPAYEIRPVTTEEDVERERQRSAAEVVDSASIPELVGLWKEGDDKYFFTGSKLINLEALRGVQAFRHPRANSTTWRVFEPGTVVMRVSSGTADHFVGYWLFEDRFWGRVEGKVVFPSRFIHINEFSADGRFRRRAASLHRDDSLSVDDALRQYAKAFANSGISPTETPHSSDELAEPQFPTHSLSELFFSALDSNLATLTSWFLSLSNSRLQIGPAADALVVSNEFAEAAEDFAKGVEHIDEFLNEGLDTLYGGPKVLDQSEYNYLENYVWRRMASEIGTNPWGGFGLNASQFRQVMIENLDTRGLKGW